MMRPLIAALLAATAAASLAAGIEPGEWEFTSTSVSALFPAPQTATFRRCIPPEEAANPDRWMSDPGKQSDCKLTPRSKTANTYSWQMECPSAKMRGTGTARMTASTMDGETVMMGEVQGQKFELRTKVSGQRVGPCK
jgi:hypothetical protein